MAVRPLPFWHPARLLATWFGSGLLPGAPGTWGSLAALPFAALISWLGGPWALLAAVLMVFVLGLWASGRFTEGEDTEDPGEVVIDEVAGQWLAVLPVPLDPGLYLVAFLAFRLFDIAKVWPANLAQRRLAGAWGIMADDIVAGLYAGA
ncbi:MAG: phosphatidylglycerophosphatase A, partial [Kiloniellaceae bacterium]